MTWRNLVPRAYVPFGQHQDTECVGADQKARGLWERDGTWHVNLRAKEGCAETISTDTLAVQLVLLAGHVIGHMICRVTFIAK